MNNNERQTPAAQSDQKSATDSTSSVGKNDEKASAATSETPPTDAANVVAEDVNNRVIPASQMVPDTSPVDPADVRKLVTENAIPVPADSVTMAPVPDSIQMTQPSALELEESDNEQVSMIKVQLAAFAKAVTRPTGKTNDDFRQAAKLCLQFTKHVIQYPKIPVLDTLLAFFQENQEGACASTNYMKGSTTLSMADQQQVGYLYSLFTDLANKTVVRVNSALVINVLKKPEIAEYYNRKMAGIRQSAANANEE